MNKFVFFKLCNLFNIFYKQYAYFSTNTNQPHSYVLIKQLFSAKCLLLLIKNSSHKEQVYCMIKYNDIIQSKTQYYEKDHRHKMDN